MTPTTIVEKDKTGLEMVLDAMDKLQEDRFIEGIRTRHRKADEIADMTDQVEIYQRRMNIEARRLSRFAEGFIRQFATTNNKCFDTAAVLFGKIKSTIASLKDVFKKMTPIDRRKLPEGVEAPSVYGKSALANNEPQLELFGLDSFPQEAAELYHALDTLFSTAATELALCHLMIEQEEETRNDIVQLRQIYKESCEELLGAVRAASAFSTKEFPENELEERRKKVGSEDNEKFLREGYHSVDKTVFTQFLILKAIREAQNEGLTETEAFYWRKNPEKALRIRNVIKHFEEVEGAEGLKGKLSSKVIVEFLKWCGVVKSQEKQLYERYFVPTYLASHPKEKLKPIGWSTIDGERKELEQQGFSDEMLANSFESRLDAISPNVQEMPNRKNDLAQSA